MSIEYAAAEPEWLDEDYTTPELGRIALTGDLVKQYLNEIGETPLLDAEKEVELSKAIEAGLYAEHLLQEDSYDSLATTEELEWLRDAGIAARDQMITANTRLAVNLARRYQGKGLSLLDLIQEANVGLIRGVEKFDYTKGFKFSTYATWWIRQGITRGIEDKSRTIRIPTHMAAKISTLKQAQKIFFNEHDRMPTDDEIGEKLEWSTKKVNDVREAAALEPVSLDETLDDDGFERNQLVSSQQGDAYDVMQITNLPQEIVNVIDETLSERAAYIVKCHAGLYGEVQSFRRIAVTLGITAERARQIEAKAIMQLRTAFTQKFKEPEN